MTRIFGNLIKKTPLGSPIVRDVALTVGGFIAGGPAGAAAGHGVAQGINGAVDAKHEGRQAQSYQDEQTAAISKNNRSLIQALAKDDSKTQSLQYRANRSRSASGLLGGTVTTTEKGPSATLG